MAGLLGLLGGVCEAGRARRRRRAARPRWAAASATTVHRYCAERGADPGEVAVVVLAQHEAGGAGDRAGPEAVHRGAPPGAGPARRSGRRPRARAARRSSGRRRRWSARPPRPCHSPRAAASSRLARRAGTVAGSHSTSARSRRDRAPPGARGARRAAGLELGAVGAARDDRGQVARRRPAARACRGGRRRRSPARERSGLTLALAVRVADRDVPAVADLEARARGARAALHRAARQRREALAGLDGVRCQELVAHDRSTSPSGS